MKCMQLPTSAILIALVAASKAAASSAASPAAGLVRGVAAVEAAAASRLRGENAPPKYSKAHKAPTGNRGGGAYKGVATKRATSRVGGAATGYLKEDPPANYSKAHKAPPHPKNNKKRGGGALKGLVTELWAPEAGDDDYAYDYYYSDEKAPWDEAQACGRCYNDDSWWRLPQEIQEAYGVLGWNEEKWDSYDEEDYPNYEGTEWSLLTEDEQEVLKFIGYTQESWDGYIEDEYGTPWDEAQACGGCYDHDSWGSLPQKIQEAFGVLGWTKAKWESDDEEDYPNSEGMEWFLLTEDEQEAAKFIGFTQESWDENLFEDESGTGNELPMSFDYSYEEGQTKFNLPVVELKE